MAPAFQISILTLTYPHFILPPMGELKIKAASKNVIPAKAGIQNLLTSLDSRLNGSDKLIIIRGSLRNDPY
jgi:hypothetical protein